MNRRQKHAEFARSTIKDAAARVFSRRGYHGATMEAIARAADYSAASIYKYFANKDEVFLAVMRDLGEAALGVFDEAVPRSLDFRARLRWMLVRQFQRTEDTRELFFTFVTQRALFEWDMSSSIGEQANTFFMQYLERLGEMMSEGIACGALRDGDPSHYAQAFLGICNGFVFKWLFAESPSPLEACIDDILSIFLYGTAAASETHT